MAETGKKWYVLRATSGKEGKAKEYIEQMISQHPDFAAHVSQVLVPTEKVVTTRNGKRVVKDKNRFAGYVFVEAELVGEIQDTLKNIPNVYNFLYATKNDTTPMALRESEVAQMLGTVDELQNTPEEVIVPYEVGESVKVTEGPFTGFDALIEEVNNKTKKLKVSVKIFGRKTPLELDFMHVEKL